MKKRTINHNARKGTETLITPVLDICILRDHIILVSIKSGVSINSLITPKQNYGNILEIINVYK